MPFDAMDFQAEPEQPRGAAPGEKLFCRLFLLLAVCSLATPISMAALVDIVRYIRGD